MTEPDENQDDTVQNLPIGLPKGDDNLPVIAEEVDVQRRQIKRQSGHRRLELIQLLLGQLIPLNHYRPQPLGVHGAGSQARRLQDSLYLLPFHLLIRLKEADGAAATYDLLEFHGTPSLL